MVHPSALAPPPPPGVSGRRAGDAWKGGMSEVGGLAAPRVCQGREARSGLVGEPWKGRTCGSRGIEVRGLPRQAVFLRGGWFPRLPTQRLDLTGSGKHLRSRGHGSGCWSCNACATRPVTSRSQARDLSNASSRLVSDSVAPCQAHLFSFDPPAFIENKSMYGAHCGTASSRWRARIPGVPLEAGILWNLTQALAFEPMHSGYVRVTRWRIRRYGWHARGETGVALRFRGDAPSYSHPPRTPRTSLCSAIVEALVGALALLRRALNFPVVGVLGEGGTGGPVGISRRRRQRRRQADIHSPPFRSSGGGWDPFW